MSKSPTTAISRRTKGIVVRELGDEVLVFDLETNDVHSLPGVAGAVWKAADADTAAEIAERAGTDEVTAAGVLADLEAKNLVTVRSDAGMSRRALLRRGAVVGGALVAAPVIQTIAAPAAYAACSVAQTRNPVDLATAFANQPTTGNGSNGASGFTYVYGSGLTQTQLPTTAYLNTEYTTSPKRFVRGSGSNVYYVGYATASATTVTLRPEDGSTGRTNGVGVYYTVPAGSTTATITYNFGGTVQGFVSTEAGVTGVTGVGVRQTSGTVTVPCKETATRIYFYIPAGSANATPTISVTYA